MNFNAKRYIIFLISLLVILVGLDQLSKYWAATYLQGRDAIPVISGVFELHYLEGGNTGAAWGLFSGKVNLFIIVTIVILSIFAVIFYKIITYCKTTDDKNGIKKAKKLLFALILISAGAIGNFIDRIHLNYVIDFLYFKLIDFPIFNLSDSYVTIGAVLLIILILFVLKENDIDAIFPSPKKDKGKKYYE